MCRLAAFPPMFTKEEALIVLKEFKDTNKDGTGSVYVKDNKFIVNKYPFCFNRVMKENLPLLDHMPYPGWTVAHLRAASHGKNLIENTHPFIKGDWAVVHNGVWQGYDIVKECLKPYIVFKGDTDSEVAAHLLRQRGPKEFSTLLEWGSGVFLSLGRDGCLWLVNFGGDAHFYKSDKGIVLASEFSIEQELELDKKIISVESGWIEFDSSGNIKRSNFKKEKDYSYTDYYGQIHGKGSRKNKWWSGIEEDIQSKEKVKEPATRKENDVTIVRNEADLKKVCSGPNLYNGVPYID